MSKVLLLVGKFILSAIFELILVAVLERAWLAYLDWKDAKEFANSEDLHFHNEDWR